MSIGHRRYGRAHSSADKRDPAPMFIGLAMSGALLGQAWPLGIAPVAEATAEGL